MLLLLVYYYQKMSKWWTAQDEQEYLAHPEFMREPDRWEVILRKIGIASVSGAKVWSQDKMDKTIAEAKQAYEKWQRGGGSSTKKKPTKKKKKIVDPTSIPIKKRPLKSTSHRRSAKVD